MKPRPVPIPKGLGPKYNTAAITARTPYWIKPLIKETERQAAQIRRQQTLIKAIEIATHAAARGFVALDRDGRSNEPHPAGSWPSSSGGGTPPAAGSAAARIAPEPRSPTDWEEWAP